jgi:hypothetical protein
MDLNSCYLVTIRELLSNYRVASILKCNLLIFIEKYFSLCN